MKEIILAIDKELNEFKSVLLNKNLTTDQNIYIYIYNQYKNEIISIKNYLNKYLDLQLSSFEDY